MCCKEDGPSGHQMFQCFNVPLFQCSDHQCSNVPLIHWSIGPFFCVTFYKYLSPGRVNLINIQVFWPARRLSAPNLGLVRMNSVSEEQEEDEDEEDKEELVVKVVGKPVFEEAGKDVETPTIQAGRRGIDKKATKKEFPGSLPALAVG